MSDHTNATITFEAIFELPRTPEAVQLTAFQVASIMRNLQRDTAVRLEWHPDPKWTYGRLVPEDMFTIVYNEFSQAVDVVNGDDLIWVTDLSNHKERSWLYALDLFLGAGDDLLEVMGDDRPFGTESGAVGHYSFQFKDPIAP